MFIHTYNSIQLIYWLSPTQSLRLRTLPLFPCKPLCPAVPKMTQGIFTSLTSVSSNSDEFLQKSGGTAMKNHEKPCNPGLMAN